MSRHGRGAPGCAVGSSTMKVRLGGCRRSRAGWCRDAPRRSAWRWRGRARCPRALVVKKGWKIRSRSSAGMPAAGVPDDDPHAARARAPPPSRPPSPSARRGLQRVLDEVGEHLAQPERVAPDGGQRVGSGASTSRRESRGNMPSTSRPAAHARSGPAGPSARGGEASAGSPRGGPAGPGPGARARCSRGASRPRRGRPAGARGAPARWPAASGSRGRPGRHAAEERELVAPPDLVADALLLGGVAQRRRIDDASAPHSRRWAMISSDSGCPADVTTDTSLT